MLLAATWDRWIVPFQDSGREVMTAARLLDGEVLYRDVVWRYGPLPPYLDALALGLLGRSLGSLVALRIGVALLGVEALRRLARRLAEDDEAAAAGASLAVAACAFLPWGGSWPFPYSGAALEGTVATWWAVELALSAASPAGSALAAVAAGIAATGKVEHLLPALAAPFLALLLRRGRGEALRALGLSTALAGTLWLTPVALLGVETMRRRGFLLALEVPAEWRVTYGKVLLGGLHLSEGAGQVALAFLPSAALLTLFLWVARRTWAERPGALALLLGAGFALGLVPENEALRLFPALGAVAGVAGLLGAARSASLPPSGASAALAAVGLALLPAVARQPISLRPEVPYGAVSGPLAVLTAIVFLARRRPRPAAALAAGLVVAQVAVRSAEAHEAPRVTVSLPRGTLCLLEDEAALLAGLVDRLSRDTPAGSSVAGFPEGGLVLFLADRRSPFPDDQFHPGAQDERALSEMVAALDVRRPAAAFLLNRTHPEFRSGVFGLDYARSFWTELERRYVRVATLGRIPADAPRGLRASLALYYLPRGEPAVPAKPR